MSDWPSTWAKTTVGAVIELNPKTTDLADTTLVGFVPMALLGKSYLDAFAFQPRPWAEVKRGYSHFRDGDVLLAKITPCFENGKAGLARGLPNGVGAGSTEYFVCRPQSGVIESRYLLAFLKTSDFANEGATRMTGSVGHKRVPKEYLSERVLPLPPLKEQTRIADQLDTLLARIQACNDRLDAIPALLKRFRQSVLTAAMCGSLTAEWRDTEARHDRLPAFIEGDLGDATQSGSPVSVPSSWRIVLARNAVQPEAGIVYGIVQPGPKLADGIRYVQITDIVNGRIQIQSLSHTSEEIANSYQRSSIRKGDVLLGIIRALKVAVVPDELEGSNISRSVARLRPREGVSPKFLAYALQSPAVQEWLRSQHRGMDMPVLNLSEVRLAPIPIAPTDEQAEIVRRVDALFMLADHIEARHAAAVAQVRRLTPLTLAKAFRGELVQQDPNDEPASVLLQRISSAPITAAKAPRGRPRTQRASKPTTLPALQLDGAALPAGAWAANGPPDEHATAAQLIAVLKAWGQPMSQVQARLAAVLCLQPRLFTAALPAHEAAIWRRMVGSEAEPLPTSVAALQPAVNTHWRRALAGLRARGDLVASGPGLQDTWALGPGAERVDTAGWPDGRARRVVAYLKAHGIHAVLPSLAPADLDFVHARAA